MGVAGGAPGVMTAVATVGETGADDDWVQPAERRRTMRMIRIPVPKGFITCILYGRVNIGCGGDTWSPSFNRSLAAKFKHRFKKSNILCNY